MARGSLYSDLDSALSESHARHAIGSPREGDEWESRTWPMCQTQLKATTRHGSPFKIKRRSILENST